MAGEAQYDFTKHWGVGVEMFGEIEDLANAGSFNDQEHSIGPTLFYHTLAAMTTAKGDDDDRRPRATMTRKRAKSGRSIGVHR